MPAGEVGVAYNASLTASGGPTPYVWSVDSGALPDGVGLSKNGSVSGVPTAPGTFTFTARASDSTNQYTTQGVTIKIAPHLAAALIPACVQACSVEQGCVNVCGNFGTQSGGVAPFSYQASGNIPGGMKLSGLSLAGSFPQLAQFWQFDVTITDALGATTSLSPIFYVYPHITFTVSSATCSGSFNGALNSGCTNQQLRYAGGTPNAAPAVTVIPDPKQPLPSGTTAIAQGGVVTFTMPSPGCSFVNGYFAVVTLRLTDKSICGPATTCTSGSATLTIRMTDGC